MRDRPGKYGTLEQERQHILRVHPATYIQAVHLVGAERLQHTDPQHIAKRRGLVDITHQAGRCGINDAGTHVRALKIPAHAHELVGGIVVHGTGEHSRHLLAGLDNVIEHHVTHAVGQILLAASRDTQVQAVYPFPGLAGQDFPRRAHILPRTGQRTDNRGRVFPLAEDETDNVLFGGCPRHSGKALFRTQHLQQQVPARLHLRGQVQHGIVAHQDQAGGIFRSLHESTQPVNPLSDSR